jgi:hypothetical protein
MLKQISTSSGLTFFTPHIASQSQYHTIVMSQHGSKYLGVRERAREEEVEEERPRPAFIAELLAHPVYSLASQINAEHCEALARRRAVSS